MKKILIIDDDKVSLATAKGVLGDDYKLIAVLDGMQGLKYLENNECDLILLDINMPGMDGFETYEKIRQNDKNADIPVIFLTSDNDAETETKCFESGAMDFISKPFVPSVILSRVHRTLELEEYRATLARKLDQKTKEVETITAKSYTDAMTGLWNREYTEMKVNELLSGGNQGSLLMIDLDNFKAINDNYGHQAGDRVLCMFADTLREFSSDEDVICRIGGDEFVAFMTNKTDHLEVAEIAGNMIASLNQRIQSMNYDVKTSVSIGIAIAPVDGEGFSKLYSSGDKALYYVKNNGKNAYRFFSDHVKEEQKRAMQKVDLTYLGDILSRSDSGRGAYMLDFDSFHHIYNFLNRFVERDSTKVVSVLFNVVPANISNLPTEEEIAIALDLLDQAIYKSLRRVDVSTRYSSVQTIVMLLETDVDNGEMVVNRILANFNELYQEYKIKLEYSLAEVKGKKAN